uniref:Uncharacterized protein n=1 Tax=Solanum lycopersicum TaxID=4081 RepID=A0A3Q7F2X4_SOLLC
MRGKNDLRLCVYTSFIIFSTTSSCISETESTVHFFGIIISMEILKSYFFGICGLLI